MSSPIPIPSDDDDDDILKDIHKNPHFPLYSPRPGALQDLDTFAHFESDSGNLLDPDRVDRFLEGPPDTTYNPGQQAWSDQGGDSRDGSRHEDEGAEVTDEGFVVRRPEEDPNWLETDDRTLMLLIKEEDKKYLTAPTVSIKDLGYPTIERLKGDRSFAGSAREGDDFDREMEKFTDQGHVLPNDDFTIFSMVQTFDKAIAYGLEAQESFLAASKKLHTDKKTVVFFPGEQYSEW